MKTKRLISLILAIIMLTGLCGCGKKEPIKFSNMFFDAFDTVITITAYCDDEKTFNGLYELAEAGFMHYHKLFDIYHSYAGMTSLKDVNDSAAITPVKVDLEIIELLSYAKELYKKTNGRMNIAMGSVLKVWHDARDMAESGSENPLPDPELLKERAKHCNIDDLVIDEAACTVFFRDPEMSLDVGAVGKGFATEKVINMLAEKGAKSILINAGGNVRASGAKPDKSSWRIGIQNPDTKGGEAYVETIDIESMSVVTSGVYERNFVYDGRIYHHIIDPDTLFPELRYQSVTILTGNSALADALSTAVFNMDLDAGKAFIKALDGVEAMWILNDGSKVYSDKFK